MKKFFILFCLLFGLSQVMLSAGYVTTGEKVTITIKGVPQTEQAAINGEYVVSDGGLLYMPMLSNGIKASGSSSSSVARRIEAAYKSAKIYANPRITIITVKDEIALEKTMKKNNEFVTVAGHVKRPGPVQYNQGMSIYDAVATAGDATAFGAMNRVQLLRNGKRSLYNLKKDSHRTYKVKPGDTITVPEKNFLGQ
ncbi:polysaccharide biosynthesis/export family protein [Rubritalea spongiae]|uniref:Polysaccharide biosynthesis/export family protein n=1 Tax=Rubritalea spongiae TaxID=430797 RepID=A0ABW5E4J5_9BACT